MASNMRNTYIALLYFLTQATGRCSFSLSYVFECVWIFNPLLRPSRRPSQRWQWLNFCFGQKACHRNWESVSKTEFTLPKIFPHLQMPSRSDRHWVCIQKTSTRGDRGKLTRHSRRGLQVDRHDFNNDWKRSSKQTLCAEKVPFSFSEPTAQTTEGASKFRSFRAILVVRTHLAMYCGSESTSFCFLVSDEAHTVSIGAHGPGIFAQLPTEQKPKPDKALKAFAMSAKARLSHGPCGTHASGQGDLSPTDMFLTLAWHSAYRDLHMWSTAWQAGTTWQAMQWHPYKRVFAFLSGNLTPLFLRLQCILNVFKFRSFVTSLSLSIAQKLTPENVLGVSILPPILSKRDETLP